MCRIEVGLLKPGTKRFLRDEGEGDMVDDADVPGPGRGIHVLRRIGPAYWRVEIRVAALHRL